jgi:outer membrane autotransporter protein
MGQDSRSQAARARRVLKASTRRAQARSRRRSGRLAVFALTLVVASPLPAAAQSTVWDSVLSNTNWYVPVPNLIAYMASSQSFTTPPPIAVGDQTLWALGTASQGAFSGTSTASFRAGPISFSETTSMQGLVSPSGQIVIVFTPVDGGTATIGIGQMRSIAGVPLMEMQMMTGSSLLVTHWAYMTPYDPATFTPPPPVPIPANTSPQWSWTAGTTWRIASPTLFGTATPGTFKITNYGSGYFWGLGAAPVGSPSGNFTIMGSMTPEGNVLFSVLQNGVLTSLTGQIAGDPTTGAMLLHAYAASGPFGSATSAQIAPVSDIAAGMTYFASDVGTTVNPVFTGGRLQIDAMVQADAHNFTLDGSGTNTIDQRGHAAIFAGVFSDAASGVPGGLIINNSESGGFIRLTGASTYTGPTLVGAGATLIVDGAIVSPVTVDAGGTLAGRGTVGTTTVLAGGTLAPGDSTPGNLTIHGDLTLGAGSTTSIAIFGSTASRAHVTGHAGLAGSAQFVIDPAAGLLNRYTFLSADGTSGAFDALTTVGLPGFMSASLAYAPGDVAVNIASDLGGMAGLDGNQRALAAALDLSFNSGHGTVTGLLSLPTDAVPAALSTLGGDGMSGAQTTAFGSADLFMSQMMGQGALWLGANDVKAASSGPGPQALPFAAARPSAAIFPALPGERRPPAFRTWAVGFDSSAKLAGDAGAGSAGVSGRAAGVAAGIDGEAAPDLLLGFSAAGSSGSFSVPDRATSGRLDALQLGAYGVARHGSFYAAGALGFAVIENSTERTIGGIGPTETATASFRSGLLAARLEVGTRWTWNELFIRPFVAVQPAWLWQPAFNETSTAVTGAPGVLGLAYADKTIASVPLFLGAELSTRVALDNGMLWSPYARLAWVHEFAADRSIAASLLALPPASFSVQGAPAARDAARVSLGASLAATPQLALFGSLDGEFSSRSQVYAGKGGVRLSW